LRVERVALEVALVFQHQVVARLRDVIHRLGRREVRRQLARELPFLLGQREVHRERPLRALERQRPRAHEVGDVGRLGLFLRARGRRDQRERRDEQGAKCDPHTQLLLTGAPPTASARSTAAASRGASTPTRIFPSDTAGSYIPFRFRNSPPVTTTVATVEKIAPNIVSSKTMMRLGHQATIGMPLVTSGQSSAVKRVSHAPNPMPRKPPAAAMYQIHVELFIRPNS